jgi:hypothetical protein
MRFTRVLQRADHMVWANFRPHRAIGNVGLAYQKSLVLLPPIRVAHFFKSFLLVYYDFIERALNLAH